MKTRRERFLEIGAKRVQKVLDSLESLSKCSNRNNYEFNEEDINKMINSIKNKLKVVEEVYKQKLINKKETFKF